MLKRKISAWNYIILVLSYLMGWKFMSSQSECSKPVLVNFIIIFFFIGTPLICSSITCLHVEQSQLSSTGPKSVRNLVDFSEIEPGCFMRRALPNLAVLKVDRIQNWMHGREHWSPCYYGGGRLIFKRLRVWILAQHIRRIFSYIYLLQNCTDVWKRPKNNRRGWEWAIIQKDRKC